MSRIPPIVTLFLSCRILTAQSNPIFKPAFFRCMTGLHSSRNSERYNAKNTHVHSMSRSESTFSEAPLTDSSITFPVSQQPSRIMSDNQSGDPVRVPGSDPTCTPPVTVGHGRTLILCFDGTGDKFDGDISNIIKLFSMLKRDENDVQMCFYQVNLCLYPFLYLNTIYFH